MRILSIRKIQKEKGISQYTLHYNGVEIISFDEIESDENVILKKGLYTFYDFISMKNADDKLKYKMYVNYYQDIDMDFSGMISEKMNFLEAIYLYKIGLLQ